MEERIYIPFELGEFFKQERMKKNISQLHLANEMNLSQSVISKIERGSYQANKKIILSLCDYYGLGFEQLSQLFLKKENLAELDKELQLLAIDHDLMLVHPDDGYESLKRYADSYTEKEDNHFTAQLYYLKGKYYERKRRWNEALRQYELAIRTIDQFPDLMETNIKAASYHRLGKIYDQKKQWNEALAYLDKGIEAFEADGNRPYIIYHLQLVKAVVLKKLGRYQDALSVIENIWSDKSDMPSMENQLQVTQLKIELLIHFHRYDEAIEIALGALRVANDNYLYDRCFELWSSLGECYAKKEKFANAELCYRSALKLEPKLRNKYETVTTYTQLGTLYLSQKKMKLAERNLEKAVKRGRRYRDEYRLAHALMVLGQCLVEQKNDLQALPYLEESLQLVRKHNIKYLDLDILLEIINICKRSQIDSYQHFVDQFFDAAVLLRKRTQSLLKDRL